MPEVIRECRTRSNHCALRCMAQNKQNKKELQVIETARTGSVFPSLVLATNLTPSTCQGLGDGSKLKELGHDGFAMLEAAKSHL